MQRVKNIRRGGKKIILLRGKKGKKEIRSEEELKAK